MSSVALTFFAFLGFNVIAFSAGDMENPKRDLPRAMFIAIGATMAHLRRPGMGVFGTLSVDEVIAEGRHRDGCGGETQPRRSRLHVDAARCLILDRAPRSTPTSTREAGSWQTWLRGGQFPAFFANKVGPHGILGMLISASIVVMLSLLFDLTAIASMGSAVTLVFFTLITVGHIPLAKETGAKVWLLVVATLAALITFLLFFFGTLIDEPNTLVAIVVVFALAIAVDFVWKWLRDRNHPGAESPATSPGGRA